MISGEKLKKSYFFSSFCTLKCVFLKSTQSNVLRQITGLLLFRARLKAAFPIFILIVGIIFPVHGAFASPDRELITLNVYGPGGPHQALVECARLFQERMGIAVNIIKALPYDLNRKLAEDGDIYYGGAEYMINDFNLNNPGILNMDTAEMLLPRRIGILVRKGNPLDIRSVDCLKREEIDLLDVKLEKMRAFYNNPGNQLRNVKHLEYTGRQGLAAWLNNSSIDAWVTYKSWHALISDDADFIAIPGERALRYTPIALTKRTPYYREAIDFIDFLKSDEARMIFVKHGWQKHLERGFS